MGWLWGDPSGTYRGQSKMMIVLPASKRKTGGIGDTFIFRSRRPSKEIVEEAEQAISESALETPVFLMPIFSPRLRTVWWKSDRAVSLY